MFVTAWWRHNMEAYSASLALCEGILHITDSFPSQTSDVKILLEVFAVVVVVKLDKLLI